MTDLKELPIGFYDAANDRWYKWAEIQELDSESLMVLGKKKNMKNPYEVFLNLLQKGVVSLQDDKGDTLPEHKSKLRKMFYADAFFLVIELIILTRGESKITGSYKCPKCKEFSTFDIETDAEGNEFDNREDLKNCEVILLDGDEIDGHFVFEAEKGFVDGDNKIKRYKFKYPKIKTYIDVYNYTENPFEQEKEALWRVLVSVNDCDEKEMSKLKTKYGRKMLLPNPAEYKKLLDKNKRIGYQVDKHSVICQECGNRFKSSMDITNFFVSILPA